MGASVRASVGASVGEEIRRDATGAAEHNNQLVEDRDQQYQQSTEQSALVGDRDQQYYKSTECLRSKV